MARGYFMPRFLVLNQDDSVFAEGILFADGTVVTRVIGETASTVVWDDFDDAFHVHCFIGQRTVSWLDTALQEVEAA